MNLDSKIIEKRLASIDQKTLDVEWDHDEVSIYRIMADIETEFSQLQDTEHVLSVPEEHEMQDGQVNSVNQDVLSEDAKQVAVNLKNLLRYEDEEFVMECYRQILGREPDPVGFADQLHRLRMQEISKADLIYNFCMSPEGQQRGAMVNGAGFWHKISAALRKAEHIPVVGRIGRYIGKLFRVNKTVYQMKLWNINAQNADRVQYMQAETRLSQMQGEFAQLRNQLDAQMQEINKISDIQKEKDIWMKCEYSALAREMMELHSQFEELKQEVPELILEGLHNQFEMLKNEIFSQIREGMQDRVLEQMQEWSQEFSTRISDQQSALPEIFDRLDVLEENIRNNNVLLKKHDHFCDEYGQGDGRILKNLTKDWCNLKAEVTLSERSTSVTEEKDEEKTYQIPATRNKYFSIDYFDFENRFRGSREHIKKVQEVYLPYFRDKKNVADLGCGRGEFVELLTENHIGVTGIDTYQPYVEYCRMMGLPVYNEDAVHYLKQQNSVDGIFVGQVVEHLTSEEIIELCHVAYEKLEKGCYLIMETPNPTSLAIYTEAFYMDPSHNKPIHPKTLQYIAEKEGFTEVQIVFTQSSRLPYSIPELPEHDEAAVQEFNQAMKRVSELLYGSQDYAVIARK